MACWPGRRVRLQVAQEAGARFGQRRAVLDQRTVEGGDLPPVRPRRFQQMIARAQRPLVGPQRLPVARVELRPREVHEAPPQLRAAPHEIDVRAAEPDHPRNLQIIRRPRLQSPSRAPASCAPPSNNTACAAHRCAHRPRTRAAHAGAPLPAGWSAAIAAAPARTPPRAARSSPARSPRRTRSSPARTRIRAVSKQRKWRRERAVSMSVPV